MRKTPFGFPLAGHTVNLGMAMVLLPATMSWALAETRLEQRIAQAEAPHQALGKAEPRVSVHWARRLEQLGDDALNQRHLETMREDVRKCAQGNREHGLSVKPVKEWPDRTYRVRTDSYVSPDASIVYAHGSTYLLNPEDCSLIEGEGRHITLRWSGGLCKANLIEKTISGNCPGDLKSLSKPGKLGLRSAQGIPKPPPGMPVNPLLPRLTGEARTVADQTCDVVTNPLDPDGGTLCYARAVGFAGHGLAPAPQGTSLPIESRSKRGNVYRADAVQMNFAVSQEVFVPHLKGDFSAKPQHGTMR